MADFEPCPDDICAGVIGDDGKCTICGTLSAELSASSQLDARLQCSDGNCLGIAGPDGHCTECGIYLGDPAEPASTADEPDDERHACPDPLCIGVIGDDGRCSECGQSDDGLEDDDEDEEWAAESRGEDEDDDDDERRPCPDGSCIGIIGADGHCTECGREIERSS